MDVRLPDGMVIRNVPDGTTKEQLLGKLQKNGYDISKISSADPTQGMSGAEKFAAGVGKSMVDLGRGAGQIAGITSQESVDNSRRQDAPLMRTGAGLAGNLAGNVGIGVGTSFIPGANTLVGATATGAALGALTPTATGESRSSNALAGSAFGLGGQVVANAVRPVRPMLNPEQARLAKVAATEGIPLTAAQATGSRPLAIVDSVMENLPLTAGPQLAIKQNQQQAFNKAVLSKSGIVGEDIAAPTILTTKKADLGKAFEDIATRNNLKFDNTVVNGLSDVVSRASRRLTPDQAKSVSNTVDDILSQVDQSGSMLGTNYQAWRSELGKLSTAGDKEAHFYKELKGLLDNSFGSQISGADAQKWKEINRQYRNLKTTMDAQGGAGVAPTSGNVSPAQLNAAVARSMGKEGKALGRGDLNDLSRVGQQFVKDAIPNSGTAQRLAYQGLLTGGAGTAGYLGSGGDPGTAAAAAAAGLLSPRIIQILMNSKAGQEYLKKGLLPALASPSPVLANARGPLPANIIEMLMNAEVSPAAQGVLSGGIRGGVLSLPQAQ